MLAKGQIRSCLWLLSWIVLAVGAWTLLLAPVRAQQNKSERHGDPKITAIRPQLKIVGRTQPYAGHVRARRHVKIRALDRGYVATIMFKEGQHVKQGDELFKIILPTPLQTDEQWFWIIPVAGQTKNQPAGDRSKFDIVTAPFDGIIDRLRVQQGGLVEEGEILAQVSDDTVMQVDFNVPEKQFLDFVTERNQRPGVLQVDLMLANGKRFSQVGKLGAITGFNDETQNIIVRAEFPNPDHVLRDGQTNTVSIIQVQRDVLVIPQKATFEINQKRYVYVIDKENVAHQREIDIQHEPGDLFVVKSGVGVEDKIVLDGIWQVRDGEKVEYDER
jgi:membrane fusion protein, multidrug efflux system